MMRQSRQAVVSLSVFAVLAVAIGAACRPPSGTSGKVFGQSLEERVAAIEQALLPAADRLDALQAAGIDTAYPRVRLTVLDRFAAFLEEDLVAGGFGSTEAQIAELEQTLKDLSEEVATLEAGGGLPSVPRFVTSSIVIRDGAFRATVRWPDGVEQDDWPVNFNGYLTNRDVDLLPLQGLNALAVEIGPSWVLLSETETDLSMVRELRDLLDAAADANVAVALLLSPHYVPDWAYERWPAIRKPVDNPEGQYIDEYIPFSVDSVDARALHERYLRAVVPEVAGHPALHSLILTNEPSYYNAVLDPANGPAYAAWLEDQYGDVGTLSAAHGREYASFQEAPIYPESGSVWVPEAEDDLRAQYDYYRFNDERFAAWHQWMADLIHELAPGVPVQVKISDYTMEVPFDGVDPVRFDALSQIAGNDSGKHYRADDPDYPYAADWHAQNKFFDLLRSISGQPLFNSEDHLIEDDEEGEVPAAHIRNVLWQSAIHGRAGSTVWVWARDFVDEYTGEPIPDFPGIANRPLAVVEHGRTALDLMRLGREVHAFVSAPARVAMVYSATSLLYNSGPDAVEGYFLAHDATYEALNFSGEKIDFVTEDQLAAGGLEAYEVVFAAGITHLPPDAAAGLADFADGGGRVVFVGATTALRDHADRPVDRDIAGAELFEPKEAELLAAELRPVLGALAGGRPVVVRLADSGEEAWGVEWLGTTHEGRRLVNATSYLKHAVTVRLEGLPLDGRVDLLTGEPVGETVRLEPLTTLLIAVEEG